MPQITAASYPVTLGGREFRMSPLTDRDLDELTNWIRSTIIATARESLSDDMESDIREEILGAAIAKACATTFGEPSSQPYMKSVDGVARVIFQGLRKKHPALTFAEFRPLMKTKEAIDAAMLVWKELNAPQKNSGAGEQDAGEEQPAPAVQGAPVRDAGTNLQIHAESNRRDDAPSADLAGVA